MASVNIVSGVQIVGISKILKAALVTQMYLLSAFISSFFIDRCITRFLLGIVRWVHKYYLLSAFISSFFIYRCITRFLLGFVYIDSTACSSTSTIEMRKSSARKEHLSEIICQ